MFKQFARWGLVLSKAALSRLHVLLSSFPFTLHNTTKLWHCSSHLLYFTFLLLWLSIQRQKTDNSGAYGGQEVMQINVSQSLYILALQSPCREELWGQLSIIGPQMISKEDFMPERERGGVLKMYEEWKSRGFKQEEERIWQNRKRKGKCSGEQTHVLHIHDLWCVCISSSVLSFHSVLFISKSISPVFTNEQQTLTHCVNSCIILSDFLLRFIFGFHAFVCSLVIFKSSYLDVWSYAGVFCSYAASADFFRGIFAAHILGMFNSFQDFHLEFGFRWWK